MKADELKKKLNNALANVEKRKATIERQKAQLKKKQAKLQKCNWIDLSKLSEIIYDESARKRYKEETNSELYWDICDVTSKESEIKDSYKKLEELEKIAGNWKEKYDKAVLNELVLTTEIPEALQSYKDGLVDTWDEWDKNRRTKLIEEYKSQGYAKFSEHHSYADYTLAHLDDETIHKHNVADAEYLILDLYQRIFKYTGEVTDWADLHVTHNHINGYVSGKEGNAKIESILAGGYNIQRLHVRVLVHKYEKDSVSPKSYKDMSITKLEALAEDLGVECKKYADSRIYRMRLTMSIKKAKEN